MMQRRYKIKVDNELMEAFKSSCVLQGVSYEEVIGSMMEMFVYDMNFVIQEVQRINNEIQKGKEAKDQ